MLSSSDCDGWAVKDILSLADPETLKIWEELRLGYTESLGLPMLRKEVSGLYKGISEEDVLIVVPEEGIFITINVLLKKGDHIICTYPGYQSLYEIAESLGCEITKWLPEVFSTNPSGPSVSKEMPSFSRSVMRLLPINIRFPRAAVVSVWMGKRAPDIS